MWIFLVHFELEYWLLLYPAACLLLLWKNDHLQPIDPTVFWFILNRPSILLVNMFWHSYFILFSCFWREHGMTRSVLAHVVESMYQSLLWQVLPSPVGETFLLWQVLPSPAVVEKLCWRFFWRFGHFSDGIPSIQYSKFHINSFRQRNSFPWKRDMQELNFQVLFIIFTRNFSKHAWRLNMLPHQPVSSRQG